jgi:hypothetical protein
VPTSWTDICEFYGFKRPFNFKVAIPFLLNTVILILTLVVCIILACRNDLYIGTERFYFFCYLSTLLLLAIAISSYSFLSYGVLVWCIVELLLALTVRDSFPKDEFAQKADPRFEYHPLLQKVPKPNVQWSWQPSEREIAREKAALKGVVYNWAEFESRAFVFHQNSFGLRGPELTAKDLRKQLIFVYGGSTTYDVTVSQGETWVERLQVDLNDKYTVVNFGVPGYSTTEHLIQTAFYQGVLGKKPVCAIYYVGWNDIRSAHTTRLDGAYANFHLLRNANRSPDLYLAKYSPFVTLVNELAKRRFDSLPPPPEMGQPIPGPDKRLEEFFIDHINAIKAINHNRDIRSIFIGQLLNRELFKNPHPPADWAPSVRYEEIWPLQARFNQLLENAATSGIPGKYIDAGIDNFQASDFTDEGHFTAAGSRKFALLVSGQVDANCR